jgi:hypothetical protein
MSKALSRMCRDMVTGTSLPRHINQAARVRADLSNLRHLVQPRMSRPRRPVTAILTSSGLWQPSSEARSSGRNVIFQRFLTPDQCSGGRCRVRELVDRIDNPIPDRHAGGITSGPPRSCGSTEADSGRRGGNGDLAHRNRRRCYERLVALRLLLHLTFATRKYLNRLAQGNSASC